MRNERGRRKVMCRGATSCVFFTPTNSVVSPERAQSRFCIESGSFSRNYHVASHFRMDHITMMMIKLSLTQPLDTLRLLLFFGVAVIGKRKRVKREEIDNESWCLCGNSSSSSWKKQQEENRRNKKKVQWNFPLSIYLMQSCVCRFIGCLGCVAELYKLVWWKWSWKGTSLICFKSFVKSLNYLIKFLDFPPKLSILSQKF